MSEDNFITALDYVPDSDSEEIRNEIAIEISEFEEPKKSYRNFIFSLLAILIFLGILSLIIFYS